MRRHALIKHSGEFEKKFQCELCGRRYAIKQSLRIVTIFQIKLRSTDNNNESSKLQ